VLLLVPGICVLYSTCIQGHLSTLLHDVVEGTTVINHVLDDRVRSGAEWLQGHRLAISELEQTLLTSRSVLSRTMRAAIYGQTTGTTDAFTAVRCKSEWLFATLNNLVVDVVQKFED